jgi:hypothetical protein
MRKSLNVLKLFSLVLVLPFLLNSCATKNTKKMDWVPDPSLIEGKPPSLVEQLKQGSIALCRNEAVSKVIETHRKEIESIRKNNCLGQYCFDPKDMYPEDLRKFFKECMERRGYHLVEIENK